VPTLASYASMMQRDRKREGLRVCRAAWLIGVSVREYREIEAGERMLSLDVYRRISELYGWPDGYLDSSGRERYCRGTSSIGR
jgi:hypothetical protein